MLVIVYVIIDIKFNFTEITTKKAIYTL